MQAKAKGYRHTRHNKGNHHNKGDCLNKGGKANIKVNNFMYHNNLIFYLDNKQ